jgi:hypothetical protein
MNLGIFFGNLSSYAVLLLNERLNFTLNNEDALPFRERVIKIVIEKYKDEILAVWKKK